MPYSQYYHLCSNICLTGEDGTFMQELSFDTWSLSACWRSNRRDPATWQNLSAAPSGLITDRGYTGHLHLDGFKLINMNGRVYDPVLGRFLSPDNFVQDAGSTQDYNRYSYCGNNLLIYTDPSGWIKIPQMPSYDNGSDHPGGASGSGDYSLWGKYGTIFPYGLDCGAGPGIIGSDPAGIYGYYYDYNSGTYVDKATGKIVDYQTAQGYTIIRAMQLGENCKTWHYWKQSSFVDSRGVINIVGEKCYYANNSVSRLGDFLNPTENLRFIYATFNCSPVMYQEIYSTKTTHKGNSTNEIVVDKGGNLLTNITKTPMGNVNFGMDGSWTLGNHLALGFDKYGNAIIDSSIPWLGEQSFGITTNINLQPLENSLNYLKSINYHFIPVAPFPFGLTPAFDF